MKNILHLMLILVFFSSCKKDLVDTKANGIKDINELATFESEIASGVTLAFFHASWCKICKEQRPVVESLSQNPEASFAKFLEIEFDDNKETTRKFNVTGFPTLVLYKDGVEKQRWNGKGHSEEVLLTAIKANK